MEAEVVINEGLDKVVTVVVAWLKACCYVYLSACVLDCCLFEGVRKELAVREEVVGLALVDQDLENRFALCDTDQFSGIPRLPLFRAAKVSAEGLLSPRAVDRVADGGKS